MNSNTSAVASGVLAERIWRAILLAGLVSFVIFFYGHVLRAPDQMVLASSGDGVKNGYTLMWAANNESAWLEHSGSNHPYGDHLFYADAHPLLAWIIRCIPGAAPHGIGILNVLLLLGLVACGLCLFELLRDLKVAPWAAAVGAFSITVLQPQVFRMGGHFSLAHAWMIPLFMLLSLRLHTAAPWFRTGLIAGAVLLAAYLTHPYMGLMGSMVIGGHGLCRVLLRVEGRLSAGTAMLRSVPVAVAPLAVFFALLSVGDAVADRPVGALGADLYATRVLSLIVPIDDPFYTPMKDLLRDEALEWEARCYLGLSPLLVLIVAGALQLRRWCVRTQRSQADEASAFLAAGFLVLLFAMGVWQDVLGGWVSGLEQFRATGRFAWVFFHAAAVFCVVRAYQWLVLEEGSRAVRSITGFTVVVGFMAVEGWAYHSRAREADSGMANTFRRAALDDDQRMLLEAMEAADADALIPLPWVHIGSEHYLLQPSSEHMAFVLPLAYHACLPLMAGITSRTSASQTRALYSLFAPAYFPKSVADRLPDDARYLLLRSREPVSPAEAELWRKATPLFRNEAGMLRVITKAALVPDDRLLRQEWYAAMRDSLPALGGVRFSLANRAAPEELYACTQFGKDSLMGRVMDWNELVRIEPGSLDTARTYELSMLYRGENAGAVKANLILVAEAADSTDGRWEDIGSLRGMPMQLADGELVAAFRFKPECPECRYMVLINGDRLDPTRFLVRDVVVRPASVDAWQEGEWNGRPVVFLNGFPLTWSGSLLPRDEGN